MAGTESARVAQAYISIHARKAESFDEDVRRAGKEAGQAYSKEFEKNADKGVTGSKAKRVAQGKAIGADIGDAAGAEAGSRTSKGITDGLVRARSRRVREGEDVGVSLGDGASKGFGSRFLTGLRATSTRAGKTLESDIYAGLSKGFKRGLVGAAGIGALASSASGLGTVVAGTVGAVTQLSGAIALLPAVGAAGAVSMAALKIGVHDVGDALSNSSDPKAYAESLKKLSPAAQSFTKAVVKLKPELKGLRNEVQQGLFKGLDKQVTALGSRYIPILSKGLTGVSTAFGAAGQDVGEFLDKASTGKQVSGIFSDIGKAAGKLAYAVKPAVAAVLDLVGAGTGQLPKFADKITDLSKRFRVFVDQSKKSGDLKDFIDGGIRGFKDLGRVVQGAGRILGGIFKAGGGANGSALGTLADLLNKIGDQIARPEFQRGLGHFFDSIKEAGGKVGDALPKVADALVALEPAISKLVSGSGTAFASILTSAADAAIALAPTLNTLAAAFASLAPHAGAIVVALLAVKGALLALKVASGTVDALALVGARLDNVGLSAVTTKARVGGLSGAFGALGAAVAVVGVAALARQLGEMSGRAQVASVDTDQLANSLKGLGDKGKLGGEGLKLFANKGGFGLITDEADSSEEALERFGRAAHKALDQGWDARLGRFQSFGSAESAFRKQTEQLDKSFTNLASRGAIDSATSSFQQFIAAGVKAGVPVASLKAQFPQFSAALARAGLAVDNTTGKVVYLSGALKGLPANRNIRINTPGMTAATARAYALQQAFRRLPTNKVITVTTRFYQVGKEPGSFGNGLGVLVNPPKTKNNAAGGPVPKRRAFGGLLDPRLGGPRQDNVYIGANTMASGGEFVMNAYATAAKGVLPLLRYINAANKLPQKLATGGQVARSASVGLGDLSASQPARIERIVASHQQDSAPVASSRLHPDDIAALGAVFERAMRQQRIVLDSGAIAGTVYNQGGRF